MVSATNKAIKKPQFHVAISAEGRTYDKHQLTGIATQWIEKMGYGEQPYLIVFHKDTLNNHVHLVTTRINKQGKKVHSGFENIRALQNLNSVLGLDEKHDANAAIEKALTYSFSTKAQFMMIMESQGYKLSENEGKLNVIKFGKVQGNINLAAITDKLKTATGEDPRRKQLTALLYKYAPIYGTPELTNYLKEKHGLLLIFHAKDGKNPYGYTIIDHAGRAVYKGGEVLALSKLLELSAGRDAGANSQRENNTYREPIARPLRRDYYRAMLNAAMQNYPDIRQGLMHTGIKIYLRNDRYYLADHAEQAFIPLDRLLNTEEYKQVIQAFAASGELHSEIERQHIYIPAPIIAASIDDEAINGRNRRRKKHPRTNSR